MEALNIITGIATGIFTLCVPVFLAWILYSMRSMHRDMGSLKTKTDHHGKEIENLWKHFNASEQLAALPALFASGLLQIAPQGKDVATTEQSVPSLSPQNPAKQ